LFSICYIVTFTADHITGFNWSHQNNHITLWALIQPHQSSILPQARDFGTPLSTDILDALVPLNQPSPTPSGFFAARLNSTEAQKLAKRTTSDAMELTYHHLNIH
jgi:hypothetical protein